MSDFLYEQPWYASERCGNVVISFPIDLEVSRDDALYLLEDGDVVRVSLTGLDDFRRRVEVMHVCAHYNLSCPEGVTFVLEAENPDDFPGTVLYDGPEYLSDSAQDALAEAEALL